MMLRDSVVAALVTLVGASCGGSCADDPIPEVDVCSNARLGVVDEVLVGAGLPALFTPIEDGQAIDFVFGPQGAEMLPLRFRLIGAEVPVCIDQRSTIFGCPAGEDCPDGPIALATSVAPLHTYELDNGSGGRETRALYLVLDEVEINPGARLELTARIAGHDIQLGLYLGVAGPDAGAPVDAAPLPDASPI